MEMSDEDMLNFFKSIDDDNSGFITKDEIQAFLKAAGEQFRNDLGSEIGTVSTNIFLQCNSYITHGVLFN